MVTEHVEQDKQPEQSEDSSHSGCNVTTSRMVIEFYKEIEPCGIEILKTMEKCTLWPNSLACTVQVSSRSDLSQQQC